MHAYETLASHRHRSRPLGSLLPTIDIAADTVCRSAGGGTENGEHRRAECKVIH